jgi:hypothetical protein
MKMASAHIAITGTASRHNEQLRRLVDDLVRVRGNATQLKAVFDQTALGGDWPALAALLGIESATDAEAIYNLMGSVVTELNGPFIGQMTGRVG